MGPDNPDWCIPGWESEREALHWSTYGQCSISPIRQNRISNPLSVSPVRGRCFILSTLHILVFVLLLHTLSVWRVCVIGCVCVVMCTSESVVLLMHTWFPCHFLFATMKASHVFFLQSSLFLTE